MTPLIRTLNRKPTEKTLQSPFTVHGRVEECSLVVDKKTGKSKGFGFVLMEAAIDGEKAIKALNNTIVEGNSIRVKVANDAE